MRISYFDIMSERALKVMDFAKGEAQKFNHEYIGTEHILLGLIQEGSGVAANVLRNLGVDMNKIRHEVEKIVRHGPPMITLGQLPLTPRAKKVLEFAMEESKSLGHDYIGTEHILLGLIREGDGVAAQVLTGIGLRLDEVREEIRNLLNSEQGEGRATPPEEELRRQISELEFQKEEAVAGQDWENARSFGDQLEQLKPKLNVAEQKRKAEDARILQQIQTSTSPGLAVLRLCARLLCEDKIDERSICLAAVIHELRGWLDGADAPGELLVKIGNLMNIDQKK